MTQINALQVETGVNFGDHLDTVTKAIEVDPEMTLKEFCERYLSRFNMSVWDGKPLEVPAEPDPNKHIILRLAIP